ncbi:MAG: hypothetical protein HY819_14560 [Acidobacteria bacterium]|nr:hypothetical protein [Acidobacteriota bacterium]
MPKFSYEEIISFSKLLETRTGIVVKEDRFAQIQTIIEDFFQILGINSFQNGYDLLSTISINDSRFQVLAEKITIGETFFFRDQMQFQALQEVVLPQLIEQSKITNRPISILSAASSTGEEIYSIAILLQELLPTVQPNQIRLIGGDINAVALNKARKASYSKWSFRGVSSTIISKYFSHKDNQYHLSEKIKNMVQFQYLNLAEPLPFVELDLILLRNVLIYFNNDFIERLAGRCFNSLRDGGWLIVGTSELNRQNFRLFEDQYVKDAIFYRKTDPSLLESSKPSFSFNNELINQNKLDKPTTGSYPSFQSSFQNASQNSQNNSQNGSLIGSSSSNSFASLNTISSSKIAKQEDTSSKEIYKTALKHFEKHEFSQAENLLKKILDKESQALLLMAKIFANRGNNSESEQFCKNYLDKEPNSLEGHYLMGLIYQAENKFNKAAEELRYTILLDNNFIMGHWNLALIYQKTDDKQISKRHLLQLKRILDNYPKETLIPFSEGQKTTRILQIVEEMLGRLR